MIVHQEHNSLGNHNYNAFFYDNCEWFYHFHKNYELVYVLNGEVELTLNGSQILLKKNDFALIFPNEFHSHHTPDNSHHFHMNFKQFLNIYRTDFARDQLMHTDASITDIAHASGFQTVRTFNRVFLDQTGVTPSEFKTFCSKQATSVCVVEPVKMP